MSAFMIAVLLFMTSFALDLSYLYMVRQQKQIVADVADLAAANTSSPIVGGVASATAIATAQNVAAANLGGKVTTATTAVPSPSGNGSSALMTTITRDTPLVLGLLGSSPTIPVSVASWVEVGQRSGLCLASLLGPTNIYNSASVTGSSCTVEASTFLYVCNSAVMQLAKASVGYSSTAEKPYICNGATVSPAFGQFNFETTVKDPFATDPRIVSIKAHLKSMSAGWPYGSLSPVNPTVATGPNQTFANKSATLAQGKYGSITATGSTLTFTGGGADPSCASPTTVSGPFTLSGGNTLTFNSGCYVFGSSVTTSGGADVSFDVAPNAKVVFVFKGTMTTATNSSLSFGDATVYVNGGSIVNNASSRLTFGDGPFYLWGGTMYNVGASSILKFGNGPFYFYGGSVSNTGTMTLGNGPFYFQGGSLAMNAGSVTSFGVGDMDFYGGSVVAGGKSVTFGAGGSATTGSGTISMHGGTFSLTADTLTAIGETFAFQGGTLNLLGIGKIMATAPTAATPTLGHRNILFAIWGGAFSLYQSASQADTMSGLIYVPLSNASIYGNQTVTYPSGGCFQVVSGVLDIYQSAKLSVAPCDGPSAGTATGVLVR